MLAEWAGETGAIDPIQRQLAIRIGRAIERGRQIKDTDAERAVGVLDEAIARGFEV